MSGFRIRHLTLAVVAVASLTLALPGTASAHASLVSSSPSAGAVLGTGPGQIVLTFDEVVEVVPQAIRLVAGDGTEVALANVGQPLGSNTISADVPELATGSFVVAWRAVSADSHPVDGAFTFTVGTPTATNAGLVAGLVKSNDPKTSTEALLAVGRAMSFVGIGALIGAFGLLAVGAPVLLATRRAGVVLLAAGGVAVAGTELMIAAQASLVAGDPSAWRSVLDTRSGWWWFVRLGLVGVAVVFVLLRRKYSAHVFVPFAGGLLAVALLAAVAAGGHGITGRLVVVGFAATVVHLSAMSVWVGGLVAIGLVVPRAQLWQVASKFSPVALGSVIVLAATGTLNAWRQADSWSAITASRYGTWLLIKIVVVGGVLAVAAASRWLIHRPESERQPASAGASAVAAAALDSPDDAALRRTVLAEVFGVILIFAATSGLVSSAPPHVVSTGPVSVSTIHGDRVSQIIIDPPRTGGTLMHVYLTSLTGALTQAPTITVSASLPADHIGPLDIPVESTGPGHATATNAIFPIAGNWTITVTAKYSEFDEVQFATNVDIR